MPSRRALLASGALLATPGCSALASLSARVARIRLENDDVSEREFALTVTLDGETVHDDTHAVGAGERSAAIHPFEDRPDAHGAVTVETELVDGGDSQSTTFDDDRCYDVIVEYLDGDLTHWQDDATDCASVLDP